MKKYGFALLVIMMIFGACQTNDRATENTDTLTLETNNIVSNTSQTCYKYVKNGDTANLTLMTSGNVTSGKLNYKLKEKDSNTGTIKGEMRGDTLLAEYTFNSEGTQSVRQVAFIKKGDQLLEGFGDVEQKDGKMVFKNTPKLTYGQSIVFEKVDCL
ncbi:MAG: hypothetical protein EOO42_06410 [Flavobacteriales bacterium]|nr:MAG: hypothetical protein EOO42_06410 [Flavobacteriales bacterium]